MLLVQFAFSFLFVAAESGFPPPFTPITDDSYYHSHSKPSALEQWVIPLAASVGAIVVAGNCVITHTYTSRRVVYPTSDKYYTPIVFFFVLCLYHVLRIKYRHAYHCACMLKDGQNKI